jgi:hypothetical protein
MSLSVFGLLLIIAIGPSHNPIGKRMAQDAEPLKEIVMASDGRVIPLAELGICRMIERDGSVWKAVKLYEIYPFHLVFIKNGSLHDMLIENINRIEIEKMKGFAVVFDSKNKPKIVSVPTH